MERRRTCFIGGSRLRREGHRGVRRRPRRRTLVVTGNAPGAEERDRHLRRRRGFKVTIPPLITTTPTPLKLQVMDIYVQALLGGTLVLVGNGDRVDQARAMLARSTAGRWR